MKKILVLPLLLCLIFCSFLSLDKNLDEFDPDRTAYGSYDHRVVWGSYASSAAPVSKKLPLANDTCRFAGKFFYCQAHQHLV